MPSLIPTLIVPLIIFLSSCKDDFPTIQPQERCVVILGDNARCRCHLYSWSITGIGRITESVNKPIGHCDKLMGFSPESSVKIYEWEESIRRWLNRHMDDI